ncbi:MAG TPA: efflux RND transporter permease subunit [Pyrinomonadaceae bacterium]|jgi:CzcA family heavy metal efflux pump|nr:efflux RND transporter permease subunit [Pyrinomonadaceae bacterium]
MTLARLVSQQSRAVLVLIALLCAAGVYAAWQLPIAIFPQTDFPRIAIIVDNGVVPAPQTLVSVTRPIEEAMNGIPGIVRIKSKTSRGAAEVNLFFNWNVDVLQSLQLVQARLSQLSSTLPATASIQQVERLTFAVFPVTGYSLTSDTRDPASLRDLGTYVVKPRLARLPGVASVTIAGGQVREFHVTIDPERLNAHNVSIQQVSEAVRNSNIIASAGLLEENHQLELALVSGQAEKPEELNGIVVATVNNAPVTLADVATIGTGYEPQYTIVTADGHPAVVLSVTRQPDANTVSVVDEVKAEFVAMRAQLPKDVRVAPFYDESLFIRDALHSVRDAILIGLLLSIVILYAFLRNWGTTFVAILVIPVTVLVTFLAMWLVGLSFDLMTLGGVAAAIGLVIDDAIVVVENIYTHLSLGQSRREAVQGAVSEITVPIIGSTITPVVVFLPLTLLTGVVGVFFRSLALTMAVALLTSLVLALTFTPVLAERFVKAKRRDENDENDADAENATLEDEEREQGRILGAISRRYEWLLQHALDNRWVVVVVVVIVLIVSGLLYSRLGSEFLPEFDEGAFVLDYASPPGSSLSETDRMLRHVEEMLKATPEVESYSRRTGLELGLFITEPNSGDFLVKLKPDHARPTDEVKDDLRHQIESSEPALGVEFAGILPDLIGDLTSAPEPIEIKLFSEDSKALHEKAGEVEESIKKISTVVDTFNGVVVSGPAITFKVDPQSASRFGVTAADIASTVETALSGNATSAILQQDRLISVRVILPPQTRTSLEALRALSIRSSSGALFRLDQVAEIEYDKGQTEMTREGLRQTISVTGRLSGGDLGSAINAIKQQLARDVKLPAGMTIEYGGLYEDQQASFRELALALFLAVVLVFITLLIEFRSFAHPLSIVAGAVLALGGVLLGLFITRSTLNVVSLMGMIMVVGIVAKNGILMLDAVEDHLAGGDSLREALLRSGRRRFRPVLMTSLAAILGMLPLALALGAGAELLQPLAIAVIGGLAVALLLSLVVTPTVFAMLWRKSSDKLE